MARPPGPLDMEATTIRHNTNFHRMNDGSNEVDPWTPGGDIMSGCRYHALVSDTIYKASSHSLRRAERHLTDVKVCRAEAGEWSKARFQKSRDAARVWEEMGDIYHEVSATRRGGHHHSKIGVFECYSHSSAIAASARKRHAQTPRQQPPPPTPRPSSQPSGWLADALVLRPSSQPAGDPHRPSSVPVGEMLLLTPTPRPSSQPSMHPPRPSSVPVGESPLGGRRRYGPLAQPGSARLQGTSGKWLGNDQVRPVTAPASARLDELHAKLLG